MGSQDKAAQSYKLAAQVTEQVSGKGTVETIQQNAALLGQNVVREELGLFGEWEGPNYNLTEVERNRILVNAREDIASTFPLVTEAMKAAVGARKQAEKNKRRINIVLFFQIVIFATLLLTLAK